MLLAQYSVKSCHSDAEYLVLCYKNLFFLSFSSLYFYLKILSLGLDSALLFTVRKGITASRENPGAAG